MSDNKIMQLSDKIKKLLAEKNLKQADLCRKTNIDPGYLSRLLKNKCRFNDDLTKKIADYFNISVAELYADTAKEPNSATYKIDDPDPVSIFSQAAVLVEEISREYPELNTDPQRKQRAIRKLYEHWILESEIPTKYLAKKYFIIA